jgi:signal transduction histidine kinase
MQENLLGLLSRNVTRLRRILDDLLTLSALEGANVRLDRDQLDLGVLVTRVIEDLRPSAIAAGVEISAEVRGDVVAWVDEGRLRQVLENLLQNAIKFSPAGSAVMVTVASPSPAEVLIAVVDRGPGIPAHEIARVFERFYRSSVAPRTAQGTGLGLPIARMIVELHGGRIWLESDGRSGTSAYISLPKRPPPVP